MAQYLYSEVAAVPARLQNGIMTRLVDYATIWYILCAKMLSREYLARIDGIIPIWVVHLFLMDSCQHLYALLVSKSPPLAHFGMTNIPEWDLT